MKYALFEESKEVKITLGQAYALYRQFIDFQIEEDNEREKKQKKTREQEKRAQQEERQNRA